MQQGFELFLIAAEELNFSKAAQRAYVTQQCLSDHIKRLEQQYGVPLFYRKPRLSLTEYGAVLLAAVQNMKLIETNLENDFCELSGEERGVFTFGINATRARILLPEIYPDFHRRFPHVELNIRLNETRSMQSLLLNGRLDMFLGVDTIVQPLLASHFICENPLFCVFSADTFRLLFGELSEEALSGCKDGVDLASFQDVPFLLCLPESTTRQMIVNALSRQNIYLKNSISISDYETHFALCAKNTMVTVCPAIAVSQVKSMNMTLPWEKRLLVFPIRNFKSSLSVQLVYHRDLHLTGYMKYFIRLLEREMGRQNEEAERYMDEVVLGG